MSRYDGLIIPRSYSEYINKTDSATFLQMLQKLTNIYSNAVTAGDNKAVTSNAVSRALLEFLKKEDFDDVIKNYLKKTEVEQEVSNVINRALAEDLKVVEYKKSADINANGIVDFNIDCSLQGFKPLLCQLAFVNDNKIVPYRQQVINNGVIVSVQNYNNVKLTLKVIISVLYKKVTS